jgi:hypothetical protein
MTKSLIFSVLLLSCAIAIAAEQDENGWPNNDWSEDWEAVEEPLFHGFAEIGYSDFINSSNRSQRPLEEVRWRIEWSDKTSDFNINIKGDLFYDSIRSGNELSAQFREANFESTFGSSFDMKLGRQILTWGTGDLIFINDLFPKDWQSFFSGRDDEYLKAPSDAIKVSWYSNSVNLTLVLTPKFDTDRYLNGERFSFWTDSQTIEQPEPIVKAKAPDEDDWELATRLYSRVNSVEWALYGYRGFYKSPNGMNQQGEFIFPRLNVLGASLRTTVGNGIGYFETGYYNSIEDSSGSNPFLPNSQWRYLLGYEQELIKNVSANVQYYVEQTQDYSELIDNSFEPTQEPNKLHKQFTVRITQQAFQQNLINSLFIFYSPDESDWHFRLKTEYRISDAWKIAAGFNRSNGDQPFTFWSQFQENTNLWLRIRYNY